MKARSVLMGLVMAGSMSLAGQAPADPQIGCAGKEGPNKLAVQVLGLRNQTGEVVVTLYPSDPRRFLAPRGKLLRQRVKAVTPAACFWLLAPGTYAVAIYHDANADHDFNRNALGLPTEGFGFSNDPATKYGVPSFEAARFNAKTGYTSLNIHMRYLR